MVQATCKGAYSQYLSTQAFIADISRSAPRRLELARARRSSDARHSARLGE